MLIQVYHVKFLYLFIFLSTHKRLYWVRHLSIFYVQSITAMSDPNIFRRRHRVHFCQSYLFVFSVSTECVFYHFVLLIIISMMVGMITWVYIRRLRAYKIIRIKVVLIDYIVYVSDVGSQFQYNLIQFNYKLNQVTLPLLTVL